MIGRMQYNLKLDLQKRPLPAPLCFEKWTHSFCNVDEMAVREATTDKREPNRHPMLASKAGTLDDGGSQECPHFVQNLSSIYQKWHVISGYSTSSPGCPCSRCQVEPRQGHSDRRPQCSD